MKTTTTFAFLVALLTLAICFTPTAQAADVTFDWATVGNPGNAGELSGAGAGGFGPDAIVGGVANTYRISKTEVTNARYTDFLNAVAVTDTNSLYNTLMNSGTFDQGGNVWEWNEAVVSSSGRGGSWGSRSISFSDSLAASSRFFVSPTFEERDFGFRVASIPEPSTLLLGTLAAVGLLMRRRKISRFGASHGSC